jgi:hypothetical protein
MKKKLYLVLFVLILVFIGCNNVKDESAILAETIIAPMSKIKVSEIDLKEVKIFNQQFAGVDNIKKEFFIIDYISEFEKRKILVKFVDMKTGEIKRVKKLNRGDVAAPGMFAPIIARINYSNGKYYILNSKISELNDQFAYRDCFMNRKFNIQCLDYYRSEKDTKIIFGNWGNSRNDGFFGESKVTEVLIGNLKANKPLGIIDKKIAEFSFSSNDKTIVNFDGKIDISIFYLCPKVFCFLKKDNLYYTESSRQGYYIYNLKNNQKKFIQIPWLTKKRFSDSDALNLGTYKTKDFNDIVKEKGLGKGKTFYKSFKDKQLYFVWILNIEKDKIAVISNIDTEKKTLNVDFLFAESGEYIKSITLPMGAHFAQTLRNELPSFAPFYINYEKGIYIYGDRDDDWNELVRFCKFTIRK